MDTNSILLIIFLSAAVEYLIIRVAYIIGRSKGYLEGRDYANARWSDFVSMRCDGNFIRENEYELGQLDYQHFDKER